MLRLNVRTVGSWRSVQANWLSISRVVLRLRGSGTAPLSATLTEPLLTMSGATVRPGGTKVRTTPLREACGPSRRALTNAVISCCPCGTCTTSGTRIRPVGSK